MIEGQNLELNKDVAIIWGASEFDLKDTLKTENNNDEYVLIDNPINRIKEIKY